MSDAELFYLETTVRWWNWQQGKQIGVTAWQSLDAFEARATTSLSPKGDLIAVGSRQGALRLLEAKTGKELGVFEGNKRPVVAAAFSPDGRTLAPGYVCNVQCNALCARNQVAILQQKLQRCDCQNGGDAAGACNRLLSHAAGGSIFLPQVFLFIEFEQKDSGQKNGKSPNDCS